VRRPAALIAAWVALVAFSVFFVAVYGGAYRHQALWLIFLLSLYWIAGRGERRPGAGPGRERLRTAGLVFFAGLLALQVVLGMRYVVPVAAGHPESRSRDLAALMARHPELRQATLIADPDFLLEPLPYYLPNRTYLLRENRFGNVVVFTRHARLHLDLTDILAKAEELRENTQQPVVILLTHRLDPGAPAGTFEEGYDWDLSTSPESVQAFRAATRQIGSFAPACCSNENFDVYALDRASP
jgi:hypothetical protein